MDIYTHIDNGRLHIEITSEPDEYGITQTHKEVIDCADIVEAGLKQLKQREWGNVKAQVKVAASNAVYVDRVRITDKKTQHGGWETVNEFECKRSEVVSWLLARNHREAAERITDRLWQTYLNDFDIFHVEEDLTNHYEEANI